ncbi:unnamed protein product [Urochloa humidicola]
MMAKIALLVLIISSFLLAAAPAHAERRRCFRATMIRRAGTASINFTHAARQSHRRLSMLASRRLGRLNDQTPLWMDVEGSAYDMELSIGTPPQKLRAQADTGSDLIWTKCGKCKSCAPKGSPSFDPTKSSSFSKLSCSDRLCGALESESDAACGAGGSACGYKYTYDDGDYTKGYLANETFTLGGGAMPGVGFGCSNVSVGTYGTSSGLVGLGRGALSLVSQLDAGAFSYCLTSNASRASPLLFGSLANLTGEYNSTRLLPSRYDYIVNLQNISIGSTTTPGVSSIVFDSGTTLTCLTEPAYTKAKKAVLSQTKLTRAMGRDEFHVCYNKPGNGSLLAEAVPSMVLHFEGAELTVPVPNYFVDVGGGVVCWVVERSTDLSIIGNIMQMDFHVLHDVDNSMLSFQPANCDSL